VFNRVFGGKVKPDIRWKQRFQNFERAYQTFLRIVSIEKPSEGERMGMVQGFEMVFELSWKLLGDYLKELGYDDVSGPRPIIKQSFQLKLIEDGHAWMEMLDNRNQTTHVYNEDVAKAVEKNIKTIYLGLFTTLYELFKQKHNHE